MHYGDEMTLSPFVVWRYCVQSWSLVRTLWSLLSLEEWVPKSCCFFLIDWYTTRLYIYLLRYLEVSILSMLSEFQQLTFFVLFFQLIAPYWIVELPSPSTYHRLQPVLSQVLPPTYALGAVRRWCQSQSRARKRGRNLQGFAPKSWSVSMVETGWNRVFKWWTVVQK